MRQMKIFKSLITAGIVLALLCHLGCDSMEDNFKQYLKEYNYSGKIDSLRVYPGFERVVLAWDNPKDQKSKSIRIVYGSDSTVVNYDTLVDSVSIDGLSGGTGYDFTVYTLDAYNNLSVPTSITAFPVSQAFVDGLTPPMIVVQAIGPDQFISIMGASNVVMRFSGNMEYSVTGPGGFTKSDQIFLSELHGKSQIDIPVTSLIGRPFLPVGDYTFEIRISVKPVIGNLLSVDDVYLSNKQSIHVDPVIINLMNIPGKVSDAFNTEGKEGIEKLVDGDSNTKYLCVSPQTWMMWHMDRSFIATKYALISANDAPERDPKNWMLEGSDNGVDWTVLDVQKGILFTERFQKKTFLLANREAYSYYRLSAENGGNRLFQLAEWTLYYDSGQN